MGAVVTEPFSDMDALINEFKRRNFPVAPGSDVDMRLDRIEAALAEMQRQHRGDGPEVESHEIPDGWMLVNSDDIPWSDDHPTWELYDPNEPAVGWACEAYHKILHRCLVVARPNP